MKHELDNVVISDRSSVGNGITMESLISGIALVDYIIHDDKDDNYDAVTTIEVWFDNNEDNEISVNDWRIFETTFNEKKGSYNVVDKYVYNVLSACDLEEAINNKLSE